MAEIVENPKVKWRMRGQEFREKDDDEQKDRDEKSVDKVISRDRKWKTMTMMMMMRKILNHS